MIFKTNICVPIQALIPLALEGTEAGKVKACHALAKIASISNPEIAFPGERVRLTALVLKNLEMFMILNTHLVLTKSNLWLTRLW